MKDVHFYIDLIAAFPSVIITEIVFHNFSNSSDYNSVYDMLYIMKIFKIRYTFDMIDTIFTSINIKSLTEKRRVFKLLIAALFVIHLMSCLFIFMGQNRDLKYKGWMISSYLSDQSNFIIYITAVYWSTVTIATVGYGDITPTNKDETIFFVCIIILGSLCYAVFVSVVGDYFSSRHKAKSRYIEYVAWIEKLRIHYRLPYRFAAKLQNFYRNYINEQEISVEVSFDSVLKTFPKMLRLEVMLYVYKDAIQKVKFLKDRENEFYLNILPMVKSVQFQKGEMILRQGALTTECFIVVNGGVINTISKRIFGPGNIFGIADIVYKRNRQENFFAESDCTLLQFERSDFEKLMIDYPDINAEVKMIAEGRDELLQAILKERKRAEEAKK